MIDNISPAKIYSVGSEKNGYNLIFVENESGDVMPLLFRDSSIVNAFIRSSLNKKHIPKYKTSTRNTKVDISIAGFLCVLGFMSGFCSCYLGQIFFLR